MAAYQAVDGAVGGRKTLRGGGGGGLMGNGFKLPNPHSLSCHCDIASCRNTLLVYVLPHLPRMCACALLNCHSTSALKVTSHVQAHAYNHEKCLGTMTQTGKIYHISLAPSKYYFSTLKRTLL